VRLVRLYNVLTGQRKNSTMRGLRADGKLSAKRFCAVLDAGLVRE